MFSARFSASAVFPCDGRAARIISSEGCKPESSLSSSPYPVEIPVMLFPSRKIFSSRSKLSRTISLMGIRPALTRSSASAKMLDSAPSRIASAPSSAFEGFLLDVMRSVNQVAQHRFFLHDARVMLHVRNPRHPVHQLRQIRRASGRFQFAASVQFLRQRHEVDGLLRSRQRNHLLVDVPVLRKENPRPSVPQSPYSAHCCPAGSRPESIVPRPVFGQRTFECRFCRHKSRIFLQAFPERSFAFPSRIRTINSTLPIAATVCLSFPAERSLTLREEDSRPFPSSVNHSCCESRRKKSEKLFPEYGKIPGRSLLGEKMKHLATYFRNRSRAHVTSGVRI